MGVGAAIGGIAAAAGGIIASEKQSDAARKAARAQADAARSGQEVQERIFGRQMEMQEPFRQAGYNVLPYLNMLATNQVPQLTEAEQSELQTLMDKQSRAGEVIEVGRPVENWRERYSREQVNRNISGDPMMGEYTPGATIPMWQTRQDPSEEWFRQQGLWQERQAAPDLTEEELERLNQLQSRREIYNQLQEQGVPSETDMMGPQQREVYNRLAEFTQGPLEESPYYQWRLGEGENAINRAMAARGLQMSRPAVNELSDYSRALTGEMTQQRYNRLGDQYNALQGTRQNAFNRLLQTANLGQGAVGQSVQAAGQYGRNMTNLFGQIGQAQAQGAMNQGNISANMWSNLGAIPMNALSTYQTGKAAGVFK